MPKYPVYAVVLSIACLGFAAGPASQTGTPAQKPAAPDPSKAEALSAAVRKGDLAAVKQLLDAGIDVNTKFRYNATALAFACDRGYVEIVKLLIERGADVNAKDTFYNATPLTWASGPAMERTPGHAEVVRLLLKAGATGAAQALTSALFENDVPMVKVILDHGGLPASALTRALEAAQAGKKTEIVALLEAAGAKPAPVITLTPEQLAKYEGTYESANGQIVVKIVDGQLVVDGSRLGAPPDLALKARSETEFGAVNPQFAALTVTFQIEGDKVVSVSIGGSKFTKRGGQS